MRIGNRYSVDCAPFTLSGGQLKFTSQMKYLGVFLVAAKCFTTSVSHLKVKFFRVLTLFIPVLKLLSLRLLLCSCYRQFLRASAMLKHAIDIGWTSVCLSVCLSVRLSVTRWHCIKTAERIVMISSPHDSPFILVLCIPRSSRNSMGSPPAGALNTGGV